MFWSGILVEAEDGEIDVEGLGRAGGYVTPLKQVVG
jgi:hypothetical protein